jgi:hypothetical protein
MSQHAIGPFVLLALCALGIVAVVWGGTAGKAEFVVESYDAGPLEQFAIGQIVAFEEPGLYVFGRENGQLRILDGLVRSTGCWAQWLPDDPRARSANPDGASGTFTDSCSGALWAMTGSAIAGTNEPLRTFTFLVRAAPDGVQHLYIEVIGRDPNRSTGGN